MEKGLKWFIDLWKRIVELVIQLLSILGVVALVEYTYPDKLWIFYLSFIVVVYNSIDIIIKKYMTICHKIKNGGFKNE